MQIEIMFDHQTKTHWKRPFTAGIEGYRGEDRDPIRAALDAQLQDKISQKEREIRKVLEEFVEAEIEKREATLDSPLSL